MCTCLWNTTFSHMCGKYIVTCAMDVEYVRIVGPGITAGKPPDKDHGVPLIAMFARVLGHLAEEELQHFGHILHLLLVSLWALLLSCGSLLLPPLAAGLCLARTQSHHSPPL